MSQDHPLPAMTADTEAYWRAAKEGRLVVQQCRSCGKTQFYPRFFCISCLSEEIGWVDTSGRGRIYTFTICRIPGNPAMKDRTPYAVAVIDLEEGVRMLTEIVDSGLEHIAVGAEVEVVFESVGPDIVLPQFRLLHGGMNA